MTTANVSTLDALIAALDSARDAFAGGATDEGRAALADAFAALGSLYAALEPTEHPEVSAQLANVYEMCFTHIGSVRPDSSRGLEAAVALLTTVRGVVEQVLLGRGSVACA